MDNQANIQNRINAIKSTKQKNISKHRNPDSQDNQNNKSEKTENMKILNSETSEKQQETEKQKESLTRGRRKLKFGKIWYLATSKKECQLSVISKNKKKLSQMV